MAFHESVNSDQFADRKRMAEQPWIQRTTYDISRWASRLLSVIFCGIRCAGRSHVPAQGGVLVCSTHQSYLDPILIGLSCNRRMNYVARQSLFQYPLLKRLMRWYNAFPIDREGVGISGLKETLRRMRQGEIVLLFPEGTRTQDGRIAPIKPGFCAIAKRGRVPLVPVAIVGANQVWPRSQRLPRPAPIAIQYGTPLQPSEMRAMSDDELVARLQRELEECQRQALAYTQRP